jgi:hypothetical protein
MRENRVNSNWDIEVQIVDCTDKRVWDSNNHYGLKEKRVGWPW